MNIAVFTKRTTFHEGYGGLATQNKALCDGLVKRGHQVTVFSPKWELTLSETNQDGVKYIFVDCVYRMGPVFGFFGTWQKENWINRSVEEFEKRHQKENFDILLAQSSTGLGVIKKKKELGVKVISISHGTILSEYKTFFAHAELPRDLLLLIKNTGFTLKNFFRRQRDFVHGSDKVVAVSQYVRDNLIEETYALEEKFRVIYNGIDPEGFFKPDRELKRKNKLLFVGQIIKSKGVNDLMDMFYSPEFSDLRLDLAGSGDLLKELQNEVKHDDNLKGRVKLLGKVPHEELVENLYKNEEYGLLVFPTKRIEGFPMVLVEAMFSALPIVAYNMGGVENAIEEGKNGFLIEPENEIEFKKKTLKIVHDDKLRYKMSEQALKIAYENFTLEQMLNQYEKVIEEVLA